MRRMAQPRRIRLDPFTERLGIRNEIDDEGVCITTHQCADVECNIYGVVHGALLFAMADVGMGMALAAALPDAPRLGSISVTANFINAGKPGLIMAKIRGGMKINNERMKRPFKVFFTFKPSERKSSQTKVTPKNEVTRAKKAKNSPIV